MGNGELRTMVVGEGRRRNSDCNVIDVVCIRKTRNAVRS